MAFSGRRARNSYILGDYHYPIRLADLLRNLLHALRKTFFLLHISIVQRDITDRRQRGDIHARWRDAGQVRATIPLNDPLRRLPSNVTTFKVSDMIAPLDHDAGKTGQLRDKVFPWVSW